MSEPFRLLRFVGGYTSTCRVISDPPVDHWATSHGLLYAVQNGGISRQPFTELRPISATTPSFPLHSHRPFAVLHLQTDCCWIFPFGARLHLPTTLPVRYIPPRISAQRCNVRTLSNDTPLGLRQSDTALWQMTECCESGRARVFPPFRMDPLADRRNQNEVTPDNSAESINAKDARGMHTQHAKFIHCEKNVQ
jgi:hypothetical protein